MDKEPEIQRQFFDRPAPAIVCRPGSDPFPVLARYIGPVLKDEWQNSRKNKAAEQPQAKRPGATKQISKPTASG
jgi:hypothetical protein